MPPVAILIYIFQWDNLFQAVDNTSVESVTFEDFIWVRGLDIENNAT